MQSREIISNNPSSHIETYKITNSTKREVLTAEEIDDSTVNYAVKTLANTGLRISELINLRLEHMNFRNKI